jgi:hypothetical protein
MSNKNMLQNQVTPYWDEAELDDVLFPKGNVVESDKKIQRDALKSAITDEIEEMEDLRRILSSVVGWKNKEIAIALWAGHIEKAEELRSQSEKFDSPESVEAALIERFAQPIYQETDYNKAQLVEKLLPIIRASPISDLRPEVWTDDDRALEQIRWCLDEYVEIIDWDERGP